MTKIFDLAGKVALVTGATGGIGGAIATLFHSQGATVVISGTRESALEELAATLGSRTHILPCNLSDKEDTNNLVSKAAELGGGLDIVVCNAGITKDNLLIRMKDEDFEDVIKVNLESAFIINRDAVKLMMKKKYGRVINISSIVARMGNFGQANYCASKGGLESMTRAVAQEVASRGITANCIAPGFIDTPMTAGLKEEIKQKMLDSIPSKAFGTPKDIANCALFLASSESAYVNGQTIHVNGGMLMA